MHLKTTSSEFCFQCSHLRFLSFFMNYVSYKDTGLSTKSMLQHENGFMNTGLDFFLHTMYVVIKQTCMWYISLPIPYATSNVTPLRKPPELFFFY